MGTLLHSESRRLYSWWWDSHISPKNSKWLQENLTDMDAKVKAMIKLIEEDADSFARRAEMYYKKRPELMKLVEEFYRAYRALAERYDHATGELRQAHRTMAQAFPDQLPFVLGDDSPSSSEPDTPETPHPIRSFFDPDQFQGFYASGSHGTKRTGASTEESEKGISRKGLKLLNDIFRLGEGVSLESRSADGKARGGRTSIEGKRERNLEGESSDSSKQNHMLKGQICNETERAAMAESELHTLREALANLEAEKVAIFLKYQQSFDKLSALEKDLNNAQKDSRGLDAQTCEAKAKIQALKEALRKVEAERDASLLQYQECFKKLAAAEALILVTQEDVKALSERVAIAETESQNLKLELPRLRVEKEAAELQHQQCLEKISALERKLALTEENFKMINERSTKAECEIKTLKEELVRLNEERDAVALLYEQCLETISKLQLELSDARADNGRLSSDILLSSAKLKGAEEQCVLYGKMNESLQLEAQNLAQKIAVAGQELSRKQSELEKLTISLQDEHSRFVQAEATLQTLQHLHSQSQEEQRGLALELRNGLQMMKDLEICKRDLEVEIQRLKDENRTLSDLNSSSSISEKNLQDELSKVKATKEKLEAEVRRQAEQSDALQLQVQHLKEEIESLYSRYQTLIQQVESVDLDPNSFGSSVKGLQDENLRLMEKTLKDKADSEVLIIKLKDMEELVQKNGSLERSLLEVNLELQRSKERAKALQDSCHGLNEEKCTLVSEKTALLSQLQIITETMQNLLEKNTSLQTSLSGAQAELEGLRAKSKGLEELWQLLSCERSNLLTERSSLVSRLGIVEQKLEQLETRFTNLEDKHAGLQKDEQSTLSQVEALRILLDVEKKERACLVLTSEARLFGLEGHINDLHEENKFRKKEFEEQLEKAVNAQVEIFILQKFIQDMEDKNYTLLFECQRHVEAAKYSEKLITELENENMIQEVEAEILLDKIEMLKEGINQVMKELEVKPGSETELVGTFLPCALANIRNIKSCLSQSKDANQQLFIEKSILSTMLGQLHVECTELSSKRTALEQECLLLAGRLVLLEDEKHHFLNRIRQLDVKVDERGKKEEELQTEVRNLHTKQVELQESYFVLEEKNLKIFEENKFLQEVLQKIEEEKYKLEEENSAIHVDALAFSYQSLILKSYGAEKVRALDVITNDMNCLRKAYRDLENEAEQLEEKLSMEETGNLDLRASLKKLEAEQIELGAYNDQLRHQLSAERELLIQKERELSEVGKKLKTGQDMKTELCSTIWYLEKEHKDLEVKREVLEKQVVELSEHSNCQEMEILHLREANGGLESEVGKLHEALEECKIREVILASELHDRNSEFELWEAEAASFYFDLQISSVREALFENKVHELGNLCDSLEDVSNRRSVEIEQMKVRVSTLEDEAEVLKSQLTTCLPLIASLMDNIALLEQNPVLHSKLHASKCSQQEEICDQVKKSSSFPYVVLELQKLQGRIKVIDDILKEQEDTVTLQEQAITSTRFEAALKEIERLKAIINAKIREARQNGAREPVSIASEVKIGAEMKDIPLDQASGQSFHGISQRGSAVSEEQMLELWEAAEQDCSHDQLNSDVQEQGNDLIEDQIFAYDPTPESQFEKELGVDTFGIPSRDVQSNLEGNGKNMLERLSSDAKKLASLQISFQELKRKVEPNKRRKLEDTDYETYRRQLQEMENSMVQLMTMNTELSRTIEEGFVTADVRQGRQSEETESIRQRRVSEQAQREAEKIARLELELQRVQYALLRLRVEKNSEGRAAVSRSNAVVLLRDFFYSRGRKSKKPKKSRFCGCLRPAAAKT